MFHSQLCERLAYLPDNFFAVDNRSRRAAVVVHDRRKAHRFAPASTKDSEDGLRALPCLSYIGHELGLVVAKIKHKIFRFRLLTFGTVNTKLTRQSIRTPTRKQQK
jgi:hypothetical protein